MPCNTIQTATVELGKVDEKLLVAAMNELGFGERSYVHQNGQLTVNGRALPSDLQAVIKKQYSKQVVLSQAKKFGWQVKAVGEFEFQVTRR